MFAIVLKQVSVEIFVIFTHTGFENKGLVIIDELFKILRVIYLRK